MSKWNQRCWYEYIVSGHKWTTHAIAGNSSPPPLSLSRCAAIEMSDENPLHHMDSVVFIAYHRQMWNTNIPQIWNILDFVYRSSMRLSDLPPTPRTYSASQWVFLSEQKAVTIVIVKIFFFWILYELIVLKYQRIPFEN